MFNWLREIIHRLLRIEPDIYEAKPFFDKLTATGYEAHPDKNYTLEEIFKYNKSDCEDRTQAMARFMRDKGFRNIKIMWCFWDPDKPGHQCLEYKGKVIDATAANQAGEFIFFNYDKDAYIHAFGFKIIFMKSYLGED